MTPDEFTIEELALNVGSGHKLYVQDWGNNKAEIPILFLHGGPGNGCDDSDKQKFDPKIHRVIFHDQRGSGKSAAKDIYKDNNPENLVSDIDKILKRLKVKKVLLVGGSWGSTLSLIYAIQKPDKVAGLVIDGVFTATEDELEWLEKGGWSKFFPDIWQEYTETVPAEFKDDPTEYHYKVAFEKDHEKSKQAAYAYISMELALLKLDSRYRPKPYDKFKPENALIEMYYLKNKCFLPVNYIINNASMLTMPIYIIQGRYDMVCPPSAANNLDKALPNSSLIWTINGHIRQHEAYNIQKLMIQKALGD